MRCWQISRYLPDWSRKLASNYRYFSYSPDTAHGFLDPGKGCSFLSWETAMVATFREGGLVAWRRHRVSGGPVDAPAAGCGSRRPQAAALVALPADACRVWDAIVVGEYERAFYGSQ
jgi:hypothetical protein